MRRGKAPLPRHAIYLSGGKRVALALLVRKGGGLHGVQEKHAICAATADRDGSRLLVLCMTICHCMDDARFCVRGRPTVHVNGTKATAVSDRGMPANAGILNVWRTRNAPDWLACAAESRAVHGAWRWSTAAWVLGQALDIRSRNNCTPLTCDQIIAASGWPRRALIRCLPGGH